LQKAKAARIYAPAIVAAKPREPVADTSAEDKAYAEFLAAFRDRQAARLNPPLAAHREELPAAAASLEPSSLVDRDALKRFFDTTPEQILAMSTILHRVRRELNENAQFKMLQELRTGLGTLSKAASLPELLPIWQMASLTEGLVGQLVDRSRVVPASTFRTVASGLDLLMELSGHRLGTQLSTEPSMRILAADDDLICRHAVALALKKAFNQAELAANGEAALSQTSKTNYDVIFLDVLMPGMDGFELCSRIRKSSLNQSTPVVFVTSQNDLDARAKSNLCGGSDFITKPFLTFELALKALVLGFRGRLEKHSLKAA
jgi:CheY-like chemotaxis protein